MGSAGSGNSAAGGSFNSAGAPGHLGGSGGAIAMGAAGGGAGGAAAGSGGRPGFGGAPGFGGTPGFGGSPGSAGAMSGSAGHAGQASGGAGGAGGMTPTWTEIYTKFFANAQYGSNCNGSNCHNPGKQKGYDFSSQANGYASVKSSTSQLVSVLTSGSMPQGKAKMPAADLAIVKAWVAAGALNN